MTSNTQKRMRTEVGAVDTPENLLVIIGDATMKRGIPVGEVSELRLSGGALVDRLNLRVGARVELARRLLVVVGTMHGLGGFDRRDSGHGDSQDAEEVGESH